MYCVSNGVQVIWPAYIMSKVNWTWQSYTTNKLSHVTPDFWKHTIIWLVSYFGTVLSLKNLRACLVSKKYFLHSVLIRKIQFIFTLFSFSRNFVTGTVKPYTTFKKGNCENKVAFLWLKLKVWNQNIGNGNQTNPKFAISCASDNMFFDFLGQCSERCWQSGGSNPVLQCMFFFPCLHSIYF